jgi:hypothetical protein
MTKAGTKTHMHDTLLASGFRSMSEVIAWVTGTWTLGAVHPLWGVFALIVMIGLPTVFTTKGDKKHMMVPTPGPIRALVDFLQFAVAAIAPWFVWPVWAAILSGVIVLAALVFGRRRYHWLINGAPLDG